MYCSNHAAYNPSMGSGERAAAAGTAKVENLRDKTGCIEYNSGPDSKRVKEKK